MSGSRDHGRPSYFRRISSYFAPQPKHAAGRDGAVSPALPNERTQLLAPPHVQTQQQPQTPNALTSTTTSDNIENRSLSIPTAQENTPLDRPTFTRAITVTATASAGNTIPPELQPELLSRPEIPRAITSTGALTGRPHLSQNAVRMDTARQPSLFSRATQALSNQLELGPNSHRNAPPAPSNWNDSQHRKYLIRLWDMVEEKAAKSKYPVNTTARVVSTEKSMLHNFPELGKGEIVLERDWVEYVLGVALRHPFCTNERMGRWEILASSGGARGTWGPW